MGRRKKNNESINQPTNENGTKEEEIPIIFPRYADNQLVSNNRLINTLTRRRENDPIAFEVQFRDKPKLYTNTFCMLDLSKTKSVKLDSTDPFTEFDRNVYNATVTLFEAGNTILTPAMVFHMMTGANTRLVGEKQLRAISNSLDKLRFTRVIIDCEDELRQRGIKVNGKGGVSGYYDTYLLNASAMRARNAGFIIEALKIEASPVLYQYAKATNQVVQIPIQMLCVREVEDGEDGNLLIKDTLVRNNESRIQLKGYLARRVRVSSRTSMFSSCTIPFESYEHDEEHYPGLYEVAGLTDEKRGKVPEKRIRDYIEDVLRYWVASGYITDYTFRCFEKNSRMITHLEINIPPWRDVPGSDPQLPDYIEED